MLKIDGVKDSVMKQIVDVTKRHLRAAQARGASLKVYFAEEDAVTKVRAEFATDPVLKEVKVAYLPPSKPKLRRAPHECNRRRQAYL